MIFFLCVPGNPVHKIRFNKKIDINCTDVPDSEIADLVLLHVCKETLLPTIPCYELGKISNAWESEPENHNYMVFGFPSDDRDIDVDKMHIHCAQHSFSCSYAGESVLDACYKLNINTDTKCCSVSVDGYSGAPVFAWHKDATSVYEGVLCGVAIQASESTINFLRRGVIDEVAKNLCAQVRQVTEALDVSDS